MDTGVEAHGNPSHPRALKPAAQPGVPCTAPSTPNSRVGVKSPIVQGRDTMVAQFVGIDVSKVKLDVFVHPLGLVLSVDRTEAGLATLAEQLRGPGRKGGSHGSGNSGGALLAPLAPLRRRGVTKAWRSMASRDWAFRP